MISLPSVSSAYQDVHGLIVPEWLCTAVVVIGLVGFLLGIPLAGFAKKGSWKDAGQVLVISAAVAAAVLVVMLDNDGVSTAERRMSANIEQKYGATLSEESNFPVFAEQLSENFEYVVTFPSGKEEARNIRFDPKTSEPFMEETPAPADGTAPDPDDPSMNTDISGPTDE